MSDFYVRVIHALITPKVSGIKASNEWGVIANCLLVIFLGFTNGRDKRSMNYSTNNNFVLL